MNPILAALQNMGIIKKPQIVSPLPQSDSPEGYNNEATNPALAQYYAQQQQANQITPQQGQAAIASSQPKTVQYPSWMANAPGGPNLATMLANKQANQTTTNVPGFDVNSIKAAISKIGEVVPAAAETQVYPEGATSYEKSASKIFDKYGVPPAIGLGIWAMEGRGKTINPNNPYNIGAYDTNPQNANAYDFKSPSEGTDEAAKFLAGKSTYQTPTVQKLFQTALAQYKKTNDQNAYLQAIASTYSTNPNYFNTIINTPEYQRWSYNK